MMLNVSKIGMYKLLRDKAKDLDAVFPFPAKKETSFRATEDFTFVLSWRKQPQNFCATLTDFADTGFALLHLEIYERGKLTVERMVTVPVKSLAAYGMTKEGS